MTMITSFALLFILCYLLIAFIATKSDGFIIKNVKTISTRTNNKYLVALSMSSGRGFGNINPNNDNVNPQHSSIPKPNVIVPSKGSQNPNLEKFLMMYTCKICSGRNAHMVSKVAYTSGMVVATCRHCKTKHLIADNERKLDFPVEYGRKIEEYLESKGERVQRVSVSPKDLEDNYLVDEDGVVSLVPKMAGQV